MVTWIARGLGVVGAIALAAALANFVMPGLAFPSRTTCVTDYDVIVCYLSPWAAVPWLAITGGVGIAVGLADRRRQDVSTRASADATT